MTTTLEQIARERPVAKNYKGDGGTTDYIQDLNAYADRLEDALQTAAKQPEGADWADEQRVREAVWNAIEEHNKTEYSPSTRGIRYEHVFTDRIMSAIRPLLAGQVAGGSEDTRRLDFLEKRTHSIIPDSEGRFILCQHEDGEETIGDTIREAVDAAMRPAQPERGQG